MSDVSTKTVLPPGTPVAEISIDVARSLATGDVWSLSDLLPEIEADAATAVGQIDAGASEALLVIKIVRGEP